MSFWDGTRWVSESATVEAPKKTTWRDWAATATMILVAAAFALPFAATSAASARISTSPSSGIAGSSISVVGQNFQRKASIQLTWDGSSSGLPLLTADRAGAFKVVIRVPKAALGSHDLAAEILAPALAAEVVAPAPTSTATVKKAVTVKTARRNVVGVVASTSFDVTADPPATPAPTPVPTPAVTPGSTPAPTSTSAPRATPTATPTQAPTPTPTQAPTPTPTPTQAPTPTPTTAPTPVPTPVPTPTSITSAPIVVNSNDVTIDGVTITSTGSSGAGINASGTVANPIRNLTIRNCTIKGFAFGILARFVQNLVIENCTITDADYAGIGVYSGVGGRIAGNTIRRIGYTRTDLSQPGTDANAYGITLDRDGSGFTASSPYSSGFVVDGNLVEDVPLWHGLDTHAGQNITFSNNTVRRAARAAFITQDSAHDNPRNITFTGNHLEQAVSKSGGATTRGITIVGLVGNAITNNYISSTYGGPIIDGVNIEQFINLPDYPAPTGVTISGNVATP